MRDNPVEWEQARLSLFDEYMGGDKWLITRTHELFLAKASELAETDESTRTRLETFEASMGVTDDESLQVVVMIPQTTTQAVKFAELVDYASWKWDEARLDLFDDCMDTDKQLAERVYELFMSTMLGSEAPEAEQSGADVWDSLVRSALD